MSDIFRTGDITIEFRRDATGFSVESRVPTCFGGYATNQMYWSENEDQAYAFYQGMRAMSAISEG
jgi:hypothetical protein